MEIYGSNGSPSILGIPGMSIYLPGANADADALLWKAAVVAAGGTVSDARLSLVSTLIGSLKTNGVWTLLDRLWLLGAENSQSALIDLVARSTATATNSPTFTVDRGYAGNGSTAFINLNVLASALTMASANSMHIAQYWNLFNTGLPDIGAAGSSDGSANSSVILGPYTDTKIYPRLSDGAAGGTPATAGGAGFYIADRISSSQAVGARNGVDVGTVATTAGVRSGASMYAMGINSNGTIMTAISSTTRLGALSTGASLGSSGRSALYAAINSYNTAIGA